LICHWCDQGTEIVVTSRNPSQCALQRALQQQQHQQQIPAVLLLLLLVQLFLLLLLQVELPCRVSSCFPALRSPRTLLGPRCLPNHHLLTAAAAAAALWGAFAAPHSLLLLLLLLLPWGCVAGLLLLGTA
jgi:hypothetical protein